MWLERKKTSKGKEMLIVYFVTVDEFNLVLEALENSKRYVPENEEAAVDYVLSKLRSRVDDKWSGVDYEVSGVLFVDEAALIIRVLMHALFHTVSYSVECEDVLNKTDELLTRVIELTDN